MEWMRSCKSKVRLDASLLSKSRGDSKIPVVVVSTRRLYPRETQSQTKVRGADTAPTLARTQLSSRQRATRRDSVARETTRG